MRNDVALLVIGYDPYKDVWDDYFRLLNAYWVDRPATYLATNELTPHYDNVKIIPAGKDAEWSKKVQTALDYIDSEYIVLLLEDFFTTRKVDTSAFFDLIEFISEHNIDYCKLLNQSRIKGPAYEDKDYLHIIEKDDAYGISLQPAIWNKDFLRLLVGNENYNAWKFEYRQVEERNQNKERNNCIADDRNILEITHAVVQGCYLNSAIKTFKKQGYSINTDTIKPMQRSKEIKYYLKRFFAEYTPTSLVPLAKRIGRVLKIDFVSDREK